MVRIVAIADTHGAERGVVIAGREAGLVLPPGDILIHAGDFCNHGTLEEVAAFGRWMRLSGSGEPPSNSSRRKAP